MTLIDRFEVTALADPPNDSRFLAEDSDSSGPLGGSVPRAGEGDFERLLDDYAGLLRKLVAKRCPPGIDAAELEQQVRLKLWRALRRETGVRHPASYLYRAVSSVVIDAVRSVRRRRESSLEGPAEDEDRSAVEPVSTEPGPEVQAQGRDIQRQLNEALQELAPNRRRAVALHLDGFSNGEIATMLGWSEPKVRNLVWRGLGDLRRHLRVSGVVP